MGWEFTNDTPVYRQIKGRLRADIVSGRYPANAPFPTVRQLALTAAVNPNTMQRALTELEAEGLLISRGTVGRVVTGDAAALDAARAAMLREALQDVVSAAKKLGVTKEELMTFIAQEEWT